MASILAHDREPSTVDEIEKRLSLLSKQDEERSDLIKLMFQQLYNNESEIKALKRDSSANIDSRRMYQDLSEQLQLRIQILEASLNKNPYVAVLVDGDGAIFQDSYLQDPVNMAKEAAQKLKQQVRKHLHESLPCVSEDLPVFARIFANFRGLASTLVKSGVIDAEDEFFHFTERFTNSCSEFDFVNVGRGKENADSKMRNMLERYSNDVRCKRIYFVACHDGGYFHDLKPFADSHRHPDQRVVLVETTPAQKDIKALDLPLIRFEGLFRHKALNADMYQPTKTHSPLTTATSQEPKAALPVASHAVESGNGGLSILYPTSYAKVGGGDGHQNLEIKSSSRESPKTVLFNKLGQRLDAPLKAPKSGQAQESYSLKMEKIKPRGFCNAHYLNGRCHWKYMCEKEHDVKLNAEELAIHRFRARTAVCFNGVECDEADCLHGHHCPRSPYCTQSRCRWRDTMYGDLHLDKAGMQPV